MKAWDVFLYGEYIDTVFYSSCYDHLYVKKTLVDHDKFHVDIEVYERPL